MPTFVVETELRWNWTANLKHQSFFLFYFFFFGYKHQSIFVMIIVWLNDCVWTYSIFCFRIRWWSKFQIVMLNAFVLFPSSWIRLFYSYIYKQMCIFLNQKRGNQRTKFSLLTPNVNRENGQSLSLYQTEIYR